VSRVQNLALTALCLLLFSFHVRLKQQADPLDVARRVQSASLPTLWRGKVAPDFELTLIDGSKFVLSDHVGKEIVVLNFFATWCAPCRAEMPELNRFAKSQISSPVRVIGIDAGEKEEQVASFLRDTEVHFPVGVDEGSVVKLYGVETYPITVVIGADGRIVLYETGRIANAEVAFGAEVRAGLKALDQGLGIEKGAFIALSKEERFFDVRPSHDDAKSDVSFLTGRAKEIADTMKCVCGCSDMLPDCKCATAKGMKAKLKSAALDGTNDVSVIEGINAEFCMKGMR
jgi:thiol-disulfide isomerase/thioredoxin